MEAAVARDPLYIVARTYLGWARAWNGDIDGGLEEVRRALRLDPTNITTVSVLTTIFTIAAEKDSAAFYAHRIVASTSSPGRLGVAAHALGLIGRTAEAKSLARRLETLPPDTWMRNTGLVLAYSGLRDSVNTLGAMERAAAGDGELLPTYAWTSLYLMPTGARAQAVWRRYNLDPARFARPAVATR